MSASPILGIGTSAEGSVGNAAGRALADLLNRNSPFRAEARPTSGQSVLLPQVNDGGLELGIANVLEVAEALRGDGVFAGRRQENLRAICVLFPNRTGLFVRADSGIHTIAGLKGKRVSYGFSAMTSMTRLVRAILANGGLSLEDVITIEVANANGGIDALLEGRADAFYSSPGAGRVAEADRQSGGLRMLSLTTGAAAIAAMQRIVPETFALETLPRSGLTGVREPVQVLAYDLPLLVGARIEEETVYRIARTLAEGRPDLANALADYSALTTESMARPVPCDYHAGAIKYYREQGCWPPG
ncbi:MAG: TAXI family TRAP transporter solute-binding subunit [Betaproteobacteria bacterium]|nr:TAXI family TRAP transporter solute-binding subunit [Betaproteobacteria bacterium]